MIPDNKNTTYVSLVMLAEDNPADQRLIQRILQEIDIGIDLLIMGNGDEVMEYLQQQKTKTDKCWPDMILLDINMPRMSGKDVLKQIKEDPVFKMIPVIILTTSPYEKDILEAYQLGANAYLIKPVELRQFREMMKRICSFWLTMVRLPIYER